MTRVIKKDGTQTQFNEEKIINAISKSAERVTHRLTEEEISQVLAYVRTMINGMETIEVKKLHNMVEASLEKVVPNVAKRYREYRDYKMDFVNMLDEVYQKAQSIMYTGDKSNANTDSTLVTTKRCLVYNELNKELYNKFFLTVEEKQACRDGYIYIHDKSARRDTMNCCLFDTKAVMSGGFEMGNLWYNEPNSIDVACDVLGDVIMMSASMQYGGWSTRVDDLLAPYVEKSYKMYLKEFNDLEATILDGVSDLWGYTRGSKAEEYAMKKTRRDLEQGIQGLEYKLNSVASSRGDYPFTTFAIGLGTSKWEKMVSEAVLKVRMNGQGKDGKKKPVLFPKIIFLYDENLHGEGCELEGLFNLGVECSSKAMYPKYIGA